MVEPLIVEVSADVATDNGVLRHPARLIRARPDLVVDPRTGTVYVTNAWIALFDDEQDDDNRMTFAYSVLGRKLWRTDYADSLANPVGRYGEQDAFLVTRAFTTRVSSSDEPSTDPARTTRPAWWSTGRAGRLSWGPASPTWADRTTREPSSPSPTRLSGPAEH